MFDLLRRITSFLCRNEAGLLAFFFLLLFWRLTITGLPSSLWIDEAGTFWVSSGSFSDLLAHIDETQFPQMPLFALIIWGWRQIAGSSEVALRLPSVLAFLAAGWLMFRLARRLFPNLPRAPYYCLLCYIATSTVTFASADARAYSLALLCLIWCYLERVKSLESPALGPFLRYGIAAGLTIHFCYFFGAALAADFAFLAYATHRGLKPFTWRYLISPLVAILVAAPLLPNLRIVLKESALHVSDSAMPTWRDLGVQWAPPRFVIALLLSLLLYFLLRRILENAPSLFTVPRELPAAMALFWAVSPSVLIFAYSYASGKSIFIDRYLLSQAPGLALVFGALVASLGSTIWRIAFAVILAGIAVTGGGTRLWKNHTAEDWRETSAIVRNEVAKDPATPFIAASCFLESNHFPMPVTPAQLVFLRAYMLPYEFPKNSIYFPIGLTNANQPAVIETLEQAARSDRFLMLTISDSNLNRWLEGYFANRFSIQVLHANPRLIRLEKLQPRQTASSAPSTLPGSPADSASASSQPVTSNP